MKRELSLKKNEEFQHVFQKGKSAANRQFVVYQVIKENQSNSRFGLSVSKKIGNAVMRNRIKRLMKEVLRELSQELYQNRDIVIIARKPTAEMDYKEMKKSLYHVLKVAKLVTKRSQVNS
ncbi:ribonuclease P protein component [Salipaludibacillus keqinensis]|uniref:Ribonuclease P protein component n=1 Tax=Salipaludibacillus keqinensis TaxID=2045207 RepID=A0A323T8B9_9BACI|nr:ribonuclease P protein component [Salipaludibacillus keqinensis]PYZ91799.1 ribonuclease P protein component [Salipaludibacillus keqinensis]